MALPYLESFAAKAGVADPAFPKRFGVVFLGCGVNEDHWGSEGSGADMKLSKSLSPLEPLKSKINVIHGLFNKGAMGLGIHPPQTGSLLTGAPLLKGSVIHSGISVDQMIANHVGQDTLQSSNVPDRSNGRTADLSKPLRNFIHYRKELTSAIAEQKVVITEGRPTHMPVKVLGFQAQAEDISEQSIKPARDVRDGSDINA